MKPAKYGFPVVNSVLRRCNAQQSVCPDCGYTLDKRLECTNCSTEVMNELYQAVPQNRGQRGLFNQHT